MKKLDLEECLINFSVSIIEIVNTMPNTFVKSFETAVKNSKIANRKIIDKKTAPVYKFERLHKILNSFLLKEIAVNGQTR